MRTAMELGGVRFDLDPAAISAIRYRAEYGASIATHLGECDTLREAEPYLLRMCYQMIPPGERPSLEDFARLARRDGSFLAKAMAAQDVLMDMVDDVEGGTSSGHFDEYDVLAIMAAAGIDSGLICELPILHLASVARRRFKLNHQQEHEMTDDEMYALFPRRS